MVSAIAVFPKIRTTSIMSSASATTRATFSPGYPAQYFKSCKKHAGQMLRPLDRSTQLVQPSLTKGFVGGSDSIFTQSDFNPKCSQITFISANETSIPFAGRGNAAGSGCDSTAAAADNEQQVMQKGMNHRHNRNRIPALCSFMVGVRTSFLTAFVPHRLMRLHSIAAILIGLSCSSLPAQPSETEPAAEVPAAVKSGKVLEGSWQRPDGDYVVKISAVTENGMMQADYFNPRPIRVASARWRFGGNRPASPH